MKKTFRTASSLTRYAGSAFGIVAFAACGGVNDPGLFSASVSTDAGRSNPSEVPLGGSETARGGAAQGGASSFDGSGAAGEGLINGGAAAGRSSAAGSSNAGASGAGHAGASGSAGSSPGGGGGGGAAGSAGNGGSAGSIANAGSGGGSDETCQTLLARASKRLAAAQACNYAANAMQCTGTVNNLCNCEVPVNRKESAETKDYEATLDQLAKKGCVQQCTALACVPASHSTCMASAFGSTSGSCVAGSAGPF